MMKYIILMFLIISVNGYAPVDTLDINKYTGRWYQVYQDLADFVFEGKGTCIIADFICPTPEARTLFPANYIIWVDTIKEGRFEDTNKMFVKPDKYDFHVTTQDAKNWAPKIFEEIK